ncbi:MAG: cobalamin-dependent protein [Pseudomonadota bacterium]
MSVDAACSREVVLPETELPDTGSLVDEGRRMAKDWTVGRSAFLDYYKVPDEFTYKSMQSSSGRIMRHAHMGFREKQKSLDAFRTLFDSTNSKGDPLDRIGLCLDWSMGYPRSVRAGKLRGTGLILDDIDSFCDVTNAAPVAAHFGDFLLGFPAALENTQAALSAGSTVIGNLGQYFTFRLPEGTDDVCSTTETLKAIVLMSSQPQTVMVHSNLDDGFAGVFEDAACVMGAALLEKYIVEDLLGGCVTHCYGHHHSTPLLRLASQRALARINDNPGSMVYGNTTSYLGSNAENYAALGRYLSIDIAAQFLQPSGHAINPVPVTENQRIPDLEEIIDAQSFAQRMCDRADEYARMFDLSVVDPVTDNLVRGGQLFFEAVRHGFSEAGIDTSNPVEMMLAIRRIGGKRLESLFGPDRNQRHDELPGYHPVPSDSTREIDAQICSQFELLKNQSDAVCDWKQLTLITATTDVHEHAKRVLDGVMLKFGVRVIDGGISADPVGLAALAEKTQADAVALSTYNGVALHYYSTLSDELEERGLTVPVLIGGQLNQIPEDSDDSLPVDVSSELTEQGAVVCHSMVDMLPALERLMN